MSNKDKIVDIHTYKSKSSSISNRQNTPQDKLKVLARAVDICQTINFSHKLVSDSKVRELREGARQMSTEDLVFTVMNSDKPNWLSNTELYLAHASELKDRILEDR